MKEMYVTYFGVNERFYFGAFEYEVKGIGASGELYFMNVYSDGKLAGTCTMDALLFDKAYSKYATESHVNLEEEEEEKK